jgi:hypothetical protein
MPRPFNVAFADTNSPRMRKANKLIDDLVAAARVFEFTSSNVQSTSYQIAKQNLEGARMELRRFVRELK